MESILAALESLLPSRVDGVHDESEHRGCFQPKNSADTIGKGAECA